ncbi:hypothetical protein Taro_005682 [Colocasia esculenta]|uniref:Pectinesterase n=1 Tax=Colocasia esculenta TaxID=4460 RepID=A0A843TQJ3_COLES|nr:hypothetical protein [Colocasia esculenta]
MGFAFANCTVTRIGPLYIRRTMGQYSRIVFSDTYFDNVVAPGGMDDWDHSAGKIRIVFVGVYKCWVTDVATVCGVSWTTRPFMVKSFVNGRHWLVPFDA